MGAEIIYRYFPQITSRQRSQFEQLGELYKEWNARINVISRKDIDNLYERHILHSLGIARIIQFCPGTKILDAGTGGGFPGIPLAILFPEASFHLIDSTAKKLLVVDQIAEKTGLRNVTTEHCRLENHKGNYEFVVSRAVANLNDFYNMVRHLISQGGQNVLKNGILYLKGGEIDDELVQLHRPHNIYMLEKYFKEEFFTTKKIIHIT